MSSDSEMIIEKLSQEHQLLDFNCGNPQLNDWLKRYAWTNQRAETAKTYLAHSNNRVVGYHALVASSAHKHETPERIAQGLANHPVGLILIARLAVDLSQQGKGLGGTLLRDALGRAAQAAEVVGVRAVMVHAIDDAARNFYLHYGFQPSPDPFQLMLLMKDLRSSLNASLKAVPQKR